MNIRKLVNLGMLLAAALLLGYVETLIPVYLGVPGAKLGLTNLAIILLLYMYGTKEGLAINIMRIFLCGFLFGSMYSILYSMAGGLFSYLFMVLGKKTGLFSMVGISIIGGVTHNLGQLFVAMVVVRTVGLMYYLPLLLIVGCITGLLIGVLGQTISPHLNKWKESNG